MPEKKGGQPEQALELLAGMKQEGVVPNVVTYNALLSACDKGGQPEQAREFSAEMKQEGVVPKCDHI